MPTHSSSSSLASWWWRLSIVNSISQCASAWEGKKLLVPEHGHTQTEDQALLKGRREEADRWMVVVVDFMSSRTHSTEQSTAPKLHSRHREHREQCRAMPACLTRGYRSGYRTHTHTLRQTTRRRRKTQCREVEHRQASREQGEGSIVSLSLSLGSFLLQHRVDIAISQIEESWVSE